MVDKKAGKTAIIFGSAADIAFALAYELAANGYNLILCSRNSNSQVTLQSDLEIRHEIKVELLDFDALDFKSHYSFIEKIKDADVAICAFGYLGDNEKAFAEFAEGQIIINTNYTASVSILNIVGQVFKDKKSGTIVGISSVAGDRGRGSNFFYGSAKAAFSTYLSGLRNYLFPFKVHVITVKPGFVRTKMTSHLKLPPKLTASPQQVAKAVYKAIEKNKSIIYVLPIWRIIMFIISNIPEFIFKKLKL